MEEGEGIGKGEEGMGYVMWGEGRGYGRGRGLGRGRKAWGM